MALRPSVTVVEPLPKEAVEPLRQVQRPEGEPKEAAGEEPVEEKDQRVPTSPKLQD